MAPSLRRGGAVGVGRRQQAQEWGPVTVLFLEHMHTAGRAALPPSDY